MMMIAMMGMVTIKVIKATSYYVTRVNGHAESFMHFKCSIFLANPVRKALF
jgi:hypothetical protein